MWEFAWNTVWVATNLSQKLGVTTALDSTLTCFDVRNDAAAQTKQGPILANVCYINQDHQVNQLALTSSG